MTRVVAAAVDTAVVGAVALLAAYVGWAGLLFLVDPRSFTFPDGRFVLSLLLGAVVIGALPVASRGRSAVAPTATC